MIFKVTYLSNGLKVKGYLGVPNNFKVSKEEIAGLFGNLPVCEVAKSIVSNQIKIRQSHLPALIYCRGGIGHFGRVKPSWVEAFANHGYIVFAPCYRGHEGGEGQDRFGGADCEDVHAAFRLIESFPFVDKEKISIMGFSRGSINATRTAIEMPSTNKLILWGGVSSLSQTYEERVDLRRMLKRVIGGTPTKIPLAYQERSPIDLASRIRCPVLIMHGQADTQVSVRHGLSMYERLRILSKKTSLHLYEGYGHHLPYVIHNEAINRMFSWIDATN
ncbi:MAG: alpha/beta hydrolase family protein [Anaerobacillus sp.]|uniref:alpha/beta hydrolase family protein n=1 Tax=Anaerobacillus sp. TaxID=1872506 RepID=UPI00391A51E3